MEVIGIIKIASCDGLHIGRLVSPLDRYAPYLRLEGCARVVFDPGG